MQGYLDDYSDAFKTFLNLRDTHFPPGDHTMRSIFREAHPYAMLFAAKESEKRLKGVELIGFREAFAEVFGKKGEDYDSTITRLENAMDSTAEYVEVKSGKVLNTAKSL